ncbi:MAG TPA: hypothetical protein VGR98_01910 [Streptosporangiaceae bacterium]|nr:hypothetical protein [Streptosporangiaceae bacterium]
MGADLAGRIAVVTGAGSGLGAAMCGRFAAAGMAVGALSFTRGGRCPSVLYEGPW